MTPEFEDFLDNTTEERRQLIRLMMKEGFYDFVRVKRGKHTYIQAKYPDDWQTDWRIELRTTQITPINIANQLIQHTQKFRHLVQKLLVQYMKERLDDH